ncbi:MAG TPA: RNA-binding cell elongation regulator Jag/EloR [Bacillota bacterium]|nr:RNA-binding cell elongation regulator Jag/EloR [Bacillota bacterium]
MRQITASGQTVEEAVESALEQLQTTRDQVEVTVIDEGKRGILGLFGSKLAVVNVSIKEDPIEETEAFIEEVAKNMGVSISVETTVEDNNILFELSGEKIALIIGKRGQTLNALQYLVQLAINKKSDEYYRVMLDAEGYRSRREETLRKLAGRLANRAIRINKKVVLEPMPAFERKIIHTELQNNDEVKTYSEGEEPHRYLVIEP